MPPEHALLMQSESSTHELPGVLPRYSVDFNEVPPSSSPPATRSCPPMSTVSVGDDLASIMEGPDAHVSVMGLKISVLA